MATLITKNSSTAASAPLASQLVQGELAVNVTDEKLYFKNAAGVVKTLASSAVTGDVTLTGTQTLTNKTIEAGVLTNGYTEEVFALGTSGSIALNPANGSIQTCAASAAITFTDSVAAGQSIIVMLTNGATYTVAYPTMTWVGPTGNVAPTLNAANVLVFWKVGSTLYGAHVGKYA